MRAVHKLARAGYRMLQEQTPERTERKGANRCQGLVLSINTGELMSDLSYSKPFNLINIDKSLSYLIAIIL